MVKMTFASIALIAAVAFTSQAMAARNDRHPTRAHAVAKDCVRAPNIGAYASEPYTVPPCMPNTALGTFN